MDIISYIGVGTIVFIAFIIFCAVKGGNNKGNGGNNGSNNKTTNNSTNGGSNGSQS